MNFKDILAGAYASVKKALEPKPLLSPIPEQVQAQWNNDFWDNADLREAQDAEAQYGGKPQPRVLGATTGGRNPNWEQWQKLAPGRFNEILSATQIASKKHGVPADLLMDISGAETSGGQFLDQFGGAPGQGWFQFEPDTLASLGASDLNPKDATASADLAARLIKNKQLSRWGTPGARWGTLDNPRNNNGKLTDYYSPEELNQFLAPQFQVK